MYQIHATAPVYCPRTDALLGQETYDTGMSTDNRQSALDMVWNLNTAPGSARSFSVRDADGNDIREALKGCTQQLPDPVCF